MVHISWFRRKPANLDQTPMRRSFFKRAIALGLGIAGASAISDAFASSALAHTTIETSALAPAVVMLTDAPTIAVDASLGNDFRVTLGGDRTMGTAANAKNGQQIIFQITQGSGGSSTITWDTGYEFSAGLPQPTLSTGAGETDVLGFVYTATSQKWLLAAFVNGFS